MIIISECNEFKDINYETTVIYNYDIFQSNITGMSSDFML